MTPRRKTDCSPWCPTALPWQRILGSRWRTPDSRSTPPGSSCCVRAALREELHQGDWAVFGLAALLTLLVMAWVLSSESVFQFRASLWSRATEGVEPSQLYTSMERLSWMVVTVLLALLYWMALTRIC